MALTITAAEIGAAISLVQSPKLTGAIGALKAAAAAKFGDIPTDAIAIEDCLDLAATIPALAELGDISSLMKVGMILYGASAPQPGGGLFGAFADSLQGITRPVADPDGSGV